MTRARVFADCDISDDVPAEALARFLDVLAGDVYVQVDDPSDAAHEAAAGVDVRTDNIASGWTLEPLDLTNGDRNLIVSGLGLLLFAAERGDYDADPDEIRAVRAKVTGR